MKYSGIPMNNLIRVHCIYMYILPEIFILNYIKLFFYQFSCNDNEFEFITTSLFKINLLKYCFLLLMFHLVNTDLRQS